MENKLSIVGVGRCGGRLLGTAWTLSQLEKIVADAGDTALFGVIGQGAFRIIIDETYTPVDDVRRYLGGLIPA